MQESQRTLVFVGAAVVSVILAAATHWSIQPSSLAEFSDVGEPFYPDFDDPNEATGLRVAAYNDEAARVDVFNVEFKDGLWRIPSHHNYPADGEEQLSKTATSIIGIERGALASTSPDDFRRLGVLDPLDESVTGTEGRGDRITLLDGDTVLADYIIGTKVEDQDNVYNLRRPDEDRTYRATLDIDISTKFADWIDPDLLDVNRSDLREIVIDNYSIDETRGALVPGEQSQLTRPNSTDPWTLDNLGDGEEVNTANVNSMITALEELKIIGVRPKPPGLSADLKGETEGGARVDTLAMIDLQEKGYFIDAEGDLVSNEGEVRVATADGVLYVLRFGEVFTGSDVEIEVGSQNGESDSAPEAVDEEAKSEGEDAAESESSDESAESTNQSRYLFITTQFHDPAIEPPGEKPVAPEKPVADDATEPDSEAQDSESEADAEADGEDAENDQTADQDAEYEQALADYETKLKQWETEQKEYEDKLEAGRKKVQELNVRFADWYYVISSKTFDDIRVDRAELIKAKTPDENAETTNATPDLTPPSTQPAPPETAPADEPGDEPNEAGTTPDDLPEIDEDNLPVGEPEVSEPATESEAAPESDDPSTDSTE